MVSLPSNVQDLANCYGLDKDDLPSNAFPITYQLINHEQNKDKTLLATAKGAKHYMLKEFHGGNRSPQLLCYKNRIVIPKGLQNESCSSITTLYATQESIQQQKIYHSTFLTKKKQKNHFHAKSTGKGHGPACASDAWKFNQKFRTPRKLVLKFGWSVVGYPCSSFICNVLNVSYHSSRCLASSYLGGIWYLICNT